MTHHHCRGIELLERLFGDVETGNDARLLGEQTTVTALRFLDRALRGRVAPAHVLGEGSSDELLSRPELLEQYLGV